MDELAAHDSPTQRVPRRRELSCDAQAIGPFSSKTVSRSSPAGLNSTVKMWQQIMCVAKTVHEQ